MSILPPAVYSYRSGRTLFPIRIWPGLRSWRFDRLSDRDGLVTEPELRLAKLCAYRNQVAATQPMVTEPADGHRACRGVKGKDREANHLTEGMSVLMRSPLGAPWSSGESGIFREYVRHGCRKPQLITDKQFIKACRVIRDGTESETADYPLITVHTQFSALCQIEEPIAESFLYSIISKP